MDDVLRNSFALHPGLNGRLTVRAYVVPDWSSPVQGTYLLEHLLTTDLRELLGRTEQPAPDGDFWLRVQMSDGSWGKVDSQGLWLWTYGGSVRDCLMLALITSLGRTQVLDADWVNAVEGAVQLHMEQVKWTDAFVRDRSFATWLATCKMLLSKMLGNITPRVAQSLWVCGAREQAQLEIEVPSLA